MAKLMFETDDGQVHEIIMSSISTEMLKEDDLITINCEVGTTSPKDANHYMTHIRDFIQAYFPKNKVMVFGVREGKKDIELKIIESQ